MTKQKELVEKLIAAKVCYYNGLKSWNNYPSIDDNTYDALENQLRSIDPEHPFFDMVGTPVTTNSIKHIVRMLSLDKRHGGAEAEAWGNKYPSHTFLVAVKLDGFAISNHYDEHGMYIRSVVRGNGKEGDEVTHIINPTTVPTIRPYLADPKLIEKKLEHCRTEVRGELVVLKKDFEEVNKMRLASGLEPFANPRNMAASACHVKDPRDVIERRLQFVAYKLIII